MTTKKIMTKDIRILAALLTLGAAMTACSGDDIIDEQHREQAPEAYTITVGATKDLDATRGLELSGSTLSSVWEVGEKVKVVQNNASDVPTVIGELSATEAGVNTTLTGTVNASFNPGKALQFYLHSTTFDYTDQDGTLSTMGRYQTYASCEKAAGDISVSGSTVTISGDLGFANAQAVVRFNLVDKATGNPIKAKSLTVHDPKNTLVVRLVIPRDTLSRGDLTINLPTAGNIVFASLSGILGSKVMLSATDGIDKWNFTASKPVTLSNGQYYQIQVQMMKEAGVNMGLFVGGASSGIPLLWARTNVGAMTETDTGQYFAWGDATGRPGAASSGTLAADGYSFNWTTYKYANGSFDKLTKYCNDGSYGGGFTDALTTLVPSDDAATVHWGSNWRMPTYAELNALYATKDNTAHYSWEWKTGYNGSGANGYLITFKDNGNTIFLPAAGYRAADKVPKVGTYGLYWSSSLYLDSPNQAWLFHLGDGSGSMQHDHRYQGFPLRPVMVP